VKAGLFSAVLTAFVVESYQKLSPDTSSQMLVVMQQVSAQMASFNTPIGTINSTYQPLLPIPATREQPFEPSSSDIRVNVLWFASLLFSLITASFGILIKQWLREYLAVTNPSPQARLRIRHFRYPELERWMVFEIAAVLPVLQQLSLALFFIGLCYFTESVHSSIGRTTLPLVAGWAFCFTTVTILPLFFPRCPYKTTLLKRLLVSAHFGLARFLWQLSLWIFSLTIGKQRAISCSLIDLLDKHTKNSDEQAVLADEAMDLEILAEVDTVQSNDELLGTAIFDALQQIHNPDSGDSIRFVLRVLGYRLSRNDLLSDEPAPFDLRRLSRPGYNAVIRILSYILNTHGWSDLLSKKESTRALCILFAPSRFIPSSSDLDPLKPMFKDAGLCRKVAQEIVLRYHIDNTIEHASTSFKRLLGSILQVLEVLNVKLEVSLAFLEGALETWFNRYQLNSPKPWLWDKFIITEDLKAWPWFSIGTEPVLNFLSKIVHQALSRANTRPETEFELADSGCHTYSQNSTRTSPGNKLSDALCGMYNVIAIGENADTNLEVLRHTVVNCLTIKESTMGLLDAVRRLDTAAFVNHYANSPHYFLYSYPCISSSHIDNIVKCLNRFQTTPQDSNENPNPVEPEYALRLLCFCVHLVSGGTFSGIDYVAQWRTLFNILIDLTHRSLLSGYSSSSTLPDSQEKFSAVNFAHYIIKLMQSQPASEMANYSRIAKKCLSHLLLLEDPTLIQPDHLKSFVIIQARVLSYMLRVDTSWDIFDDWPSYNELVEMLTIIYFSSGGVNLDSESSEWWSCLNPKVKKRVHTALAVATQGLASLSLPETPLAKTEHNADYIPADPIPAAGTDAV
jgi:hypothetical protein